MPKPRSEVAVSVVLATHNRAGLARQAISSALAQTYSDLEIVVVDDGSTDGTRAAVEAIRDPRLRYVYQANAGPGAARNHGGALAQGTMIAFLDDDDAWHPEKLAVQVAGLEAEPEIGLAGCGYRIVDPRGAFLGEARPWQIHPELGLETWLTGCPIIPSAALIRRPWLEAVGGFDLEVRFLEDWDLFLRMAAAGCRMAWNEQVLCDYRITPQGRMTGRTDHAEWTLAVLDRFYGRPEVPAAAAALRDAAYARAHVRAAAWEYYHGRPAPAWAHVDEAVRLRPRLAQSHGEALRTSLAALSAEAVIGEPEALCRTMAALPPPSLRVCGDWRRRMRAYGAFQGLFRAHALHDRRRAARCLWILTANEPRRLADAGVGSAAMQALLGASRAGRLRLLYRRLPRGDRQSARNRAR